MLVSDFEPYDQRVCLRDNVTHSLTSCSLHRALFDESNGAWPLPTRPPSSLLGRRRCARRLRLHALDQGHALRHRGSVGRELRLKLVDLGEDMVMGRRSFAEVLGLCALLPLARPILLRLQLIFMQSYGLAPLLLQLILVIVAYLLNDQLMEEVFETTRRTCISGDPCSDDEVSMLRELERRGKKLKGFKTCDTH